MTLYFYVFFILTAISRSVDAQVTIAKNVQVTPRCGSQLISIEIRFDPVQLPGGKFEDWIVVGVSGRPECRLRGNGETKYIIEIAVFNDPCLTQIPARNVFQNRIRIGKNPVVILEGDQSIMVKCVYGLPTIETLAMPVINPNFNIDNFVTQSTSDRNEQNKSQGQASENFLAAENQPNFNNNNRQIAGFIPQETVLTHGTEFSRGRAVEAGNSFEPMTNIDNTIQTRIPNSFTGQDLVTEDDATQQPQLGIDRFTTVIPNRSSSFPLLFIICVIILILLVLLMLLCLYFFLKRRREERNRRLLIDGVPASMRSKRSGRMWWTDGSTDGYATPRKSVKEVPVPTTAVRKHQSEIITHHAKAGPTNRSLSGNTTSAEKGNSPNTSLAVGFPAPQPLRSNLEEFVSKTYAMGAFNELSSPAYSFVHAEHYNEVSVDVSSDRRRQKKPETRLDDDVAVSSYRSITEIVHAAETTNNVPQEATEQPKMAEVLANSVQPIRGFGYRKLTEQEMGRWRNLILRDENLLQLLINSKSVADIEETFDREEYRHLFSATKWREIAQCVHKILTQPMDRSQSQLHLYVGDVGSDW
ncbi:unnamed protein product [Caenorhabditis auriculariae]|uniref:ZP domain-containing protein n=1 Tax=Caenorhabditis auriculariae TaxID=2777116 RepID=A0A8S1H022_9PELO|nr:unnamed protein product [Caenorhabditis auriculariae]